MLSGMTQKMACLRSPSCSSSRVSLAVMFWISGRVNTESRTAALTKMERGKSCRRLLEDVVLPHGDVIRLLLLQGLEQQV